MSSDRVGEEYAGLVDAARGRRKMAGKEQCHRIFDDPFLEMSLDSLSMA